MALCGADQTRKLTMTMNELEYIPNCLTIWHTLHMTSPAIHSIKVFQNASTNDILLLAINQQFCDTFLQENAEKHLPIGMTNAV